MEVTVRWQRYSDLRRCTNACRATVAVCKFDNMSLDQFLAMNLSVLRSGQILFRGHEVRPLQGLTLGCEVDALRPQTDHKAATTIPEVVYEQHLQVSDKVYPSQRTAATAGSLSFSSRRAFAVSVQCLHQRIGVAMQQGSLPSRDKEVRAVRLSHECVLSDVLFSAGSADARPKKGGEKRSGLCGLLPCLAFHFPCSMPLLQARGETARTLFLSTSCHFSAQRAQEPSLRMLISYTQGRLTRSYFSQPLRRAFSDSAC